MERKISPFQLLSAVFILPYGSAVLFFLAPEAKQDAWIAMLFYIFPAVLMQLIYIRIFKYYPNDTLVNYMPKIYGKYIGNFISVIYILYFAYLAARVLRDFSGLISISSLPHTPTILISLLLILTITYGVILGIEPLCRAAEIIFPLMIVGLLGAIILLVITKNVFNFHYLQPIAEEGPLIPILKSWKLITFPYGEPFIFTMIYRDLNNPKKIYSSVIGAIITEGIVLTVITILFLISLGAEYASISTFPLLETLRLIRVSGFMDRLDILIIVAMVLGGFFKISFFMYAAVLGTVEMLKTDNRKLLTPIWAIIVLISSELIAKNYPQHVKIGLDFTVKYIHLPLQIIIPVITLIFAFIKNHNKKSKKAPNSK